MTRTARATYPRAATRDRSQSKSGLDAAMKKGGAGQHAWGSLGDEYVHERDGELDALAQPEEDDFDEEAHWDPATSSIVGSLDSRNYESDSSDGNEAQKPLKVQVARRASTASSTTTPINEEDREKARRFRTASFTGNRNIDLGAIARTSAAASSPIETTARTPFSRK
ncbi:hypothetical protein DL93DRAFT_2162110 [Clavulina sp. PMI_390]|nr:hypothetical protein DL93DRAFT_2162110 [Clavulina sp. PMI_390]